jgi:hypothetical protein
MVGRFPIPRIRFIESRRRVFALVDLSKDLRRSRSHNVDSERVAAVSHSDNPQDHC